MRLTLVLALALLAPATALSADPPIVFQTMPIGRVLDDARTLINGAAGEKAVKSFNDAIKETFGEKGFEGLDLTRGVVGYAVIAPKLEQSATVIALPISNEKDFLDLCERANKQKPKPLPGGLYELPKSEFADKAVVRVVGDYAYLCSANDPAPYLDAKALVPANKLFDPNELALGCIKAYPDRLPKELKAAADAAIADGKMFLDNPPGGLGGQALLISKVFRNAFLKLGEQASAMSTQVQEVAVRVNLDHAASDLSTELRLTPKAGSLLSVLFAARGPSSNRFAGMFGPDTVAGLRFSLPLFTEDIRGVVATGLEEFKKMAAAQAGPAEKPLAEEAISGLIRVAKAGDWDVAMVARGPDKTGSFTLAAAMSFEDGAALDKAFRAFVNANAPPGEKEKFKWDAAKVGDVSIHEYPLPGEANGTWLKMFGGAKSSLAFAFGPKGVYVASGADAVGTMKDVLTAKPGPSPVFEASLNPSRVVKLVTATGEVAAGVQAEAMIGKEDKLVSAMSWTVTGGKDLRVTMRMNSKILPAGVFGLGARAEATFDKVEPGIKKQ